MKVLLLFLVGLAFVLFFGYILLRTAEEVMEEITDEEEGFDD